MTNMLLWTQRTLPHTDITIGPCAWRLSMLTGEHAEYVAAHPSLVVVSPEDDNDVLTDSASRIDKHPVLLVIAEPTFARRFEPEVLRRMELLGLQRVDALVLRVEDPAEVKSGGILQTMFSLREQDVVGSLGLAHEDPRAAEWLAMHSAVRLMGVNYSLADQSARHRALGQVQAHGMSAFTISSPDVTDLEAVRFALGDAGRVLPVLDRPIPNGVMPMTADQVDQAWQGYQKSAPPPPPLERGLPPIVGDEVE